MLQQVSYIGRGELFVQRLHCANPLRVPLGNLLEAKLTYAEESVSLMNGGGVADGVLESVSMVSNVTLDASVSNFSAANLAMAMRGAATSSAAAAVSAEALAGVRRGGLQRTARLIDTSTAVTVQLGGSPVAQAGNWRATAAGIWIEPTASAIADGDNLTVSYAALGDTRVEAMTEAQGEYELTFVGLNRARRNAPTVVTVRRAQLGFLSELSLRTNEFGALPLRFALLADPTVTEPGLSPFLSMRQAHQAL